MSVAEVESPVQLHPQYGTRKKTKSPKERARAERKHQHAGDPFDSKVMAIHNLRVRIKSLVEESRILRREEKRAGIRYGQVLRDRRLFYVRARLRFLNLALAFLRGRSYRDVERSVLLSLSPVAVTIELREAFFDSNWLHSVSIDDIGRWLNAV